ncbi:MAG: aspartate ammonia-lyase [Alphaproteobacteria bacterium]
MSKQEFRTEKDSLGTIDVPADAYWGVQTQRAKNIYHVSGVPIGHYRDLVRALGWVKYACTKANMAVGGLDEERGKAILEASLEVADGKWNDQFVVDAIQGGAGTSTNMNANEVIANRALEILGHKKGEYQYCHPNNDVNMSQSTNDVYPTAMRIAMMTMLKRSQDDVEYISSALYDKGEEFKHVLKMGRTQLQDAVPMTLGQEFMAWSTTLAEEIARLKSSFRLMREMNLGATAIGTGINTHPEYAQKAISELALISSLPLTLAGNLVEATQDTGAYVTLSGVLKRLAVKLSKISNDLRLLSMGPRTGLNEINLPPMLPGSSIMPGKVNPVIPELMNQIAFTVIGRDITVTMAAEAGQLELNAMEPVILYSILSSMNGINRGCRTLVDNCIRGITANEDVCREYIENSTGLATALNPYIGYEAAADIAKTSLKTGQKVVDLVLERGLLTQEQVDDILQPEKMLAPHAHTDIKIAKKK